MSETLCPVCETGHLHAKTKEHRETYEGVVGVMTLPYSKCDFCGSDVSSEDDIRQTRRALIKFKKQVDGLLTGEEVKALRIRFGITQAEAYKLFGGGPVAFSRYESDELAQSEQMDQVLRLCIDDPLNLDRIAHRKGVVLKGYQTQHKKEKVQQEVLISSLFHSVHTCVESNSVVMLPSLKAFALSSPRTVNWLESAEEDYSWLSFSAAGTAVSIADLDQQLDENRQALIQ